MNFPVFDLHCDTALALLSLDKPAGGGLLKNDLHIDLERVQFPGYCQCFACFTTPEMLKWYGKAPEDIFELEKYRDEIVSMEGFGEKSFANLIKSLEKAKNTELPRIIYALGIPNIGLANAKVICKQFDYDVEKLAAATKEDISAIDGMGEVLASAIVEWFATESNREILADLLEHLQTSAPSVIVGEQTLNNQIFVITGDVHHFANRNELKEFIENRGGKVTGSVTGKTTYLINNDVNSTSGKNKKAKELNVPIISEDEFLAMVGE